MQSPSQISSDALYGISDDDWLPSPTQPGRNPEYEKQTMRNILETLKPWPSLRDIIESHLNAEVLTNILKEIFDEPWSEYRDLFQKAAKISSFDKKGFTEKALAEKKMRLIDEETQEKLVEYFKKFYSEDGKISKEHLKRILQIANLNDATPCQKSYYLLVLSAIFTKYSSSALFGSELNSPQAFRIYANALLQAAQEIGGLEIKKPNTNEECESKKIDYKDWSHRLTGEPGSFPCTGVLFNNDMRPVLKNLSINSPELGSLFTIIPAAWH